MKIVIILYCLGNTDKKKNLYKLSTERNYQCFLPNIFNPQLVGSTNVEPTDTEEQLYFVIVPSVTTPGQ